METEDILLHSLYKASITLIPPKPYKARKENYNMCTEH